MKIARFIHNEKTKYGIVEGDLIKEIKGNPFTDEIDTIDGGEYALEEVKLCPPTLPSKVVCVGKNYLDHIKEMGGGDIPEEPTLFIKPSTSVIGHNENIVIPKMSDRVDYEGEVAVVIKNKIKGISPDEVKHHILGYTCANDVTARDLQRKDGQWTRAKSFDTFCPLGPWIETDIDGDLRIRTYLNGQIKQDSDTSHLIFSIKKLISFISCVMTLNPGDVVLTGTPEGVGPLKRGDVIEVEVSGIGKLKNTVV